ncbi:MAG: hypothetical protein GWP05_00335 [Anaerolineaceae bacterium]|nr:hypothetical protein [Anaerolineaceae bacterium]
MSSRVKKKPLRQYAVRTTLGFTCLLAVAVAITSVALYWALSHGLYRETDEVQEGDIREFVRHLTDSRRDETFLKSELNHEVASRAGQRVFYRLFDSAGRELWTVPESMSGRCLPPADVVANSLAGGREHLKIPVADGPDYLTLVFPVIRAGRQGQACQVAMSTVDIEDRLRKYAAIVFGVGAAVVFVGAVTSHRLVRRPLRVVGNMSRQVREITATSLHLRLSESDTGDEFDGLAKTLNGMLVRLEDSVGRLTQFTADAAHELRSPLARMRVAAEVALQGQHGAAELRESLSEIVEQAEELSGLVNSLLLLARQDGQALQGDREVLDCRNILEETVAVYGALAEEQGLTLRMKRADQGKILGNKQRLRQALGNLVENALKFTGSGGAVDVLGIADDEVYRMTVRDTGIGIAAEHLQRLFDRFYRVDPARTHATGGAGLGLSIVQMIASMHGGRIEVESQPGVGSTFTLVLPAQAATEAGHHGQPQGT